LNEKLDKLIKLLTPAENEVYPVKSGKAGLPKAEFNGEKEVIKSTKKEAKKAVAKKAVGKKKK